MERDDLSRTTISISGDRRKIIEKLTIEMSVIVKVPLCKADIVNAIIDRIDDISLEHLIERIIFNRFPSTRPPMALPAKKSTT